MKIMRATRRAINAIIDNKIKKGIGQKIKDMQAKGVDPITIKFKMQQLRQKHPLFKKAKPNSPFFKKNSPVFYN